MFELQDVARGRGWSGTVEKLTDKKSLPGKKADALLEALKEHELSGEKLCRFYRVDEATIKAMWEAHGNQGVQGCHAGRLPVPA